MRAVRVCAGGSVLVGVGVGGLLLDAMFEVHGCGCAGGQWCVAGEGCSWAPGATGSPLHNFVCIPYCFLVVRPQAADPDVEGVVLHVGPDGEPAPAIVCRGPGSFEETLRSIGESPSAQQQEAEPRGSDAQALRAEPEPSAAATA
jgi:hypothetical protein